MWFGYGISCREADAAHRAAGMAACLSQRLDNVGGRDGRAVVAQTLTEQVHPRAPMQVCKE